MARCDRIGRIHSFQSLGTVDGPGVRAVVFMQGCPLRCACCHNPDTWDPAAGEAITVEALLAKIQRCKRYFGQKGGVTVSGGEPLMQAAFVTELFSHLREAGIHTALDTSGCILTSQVETLLEVTDLVLLDYKYTDPAAYPPLVGCEQAAVVRFLQHLEERQIPTWIRQVIIPGKNDHEDNISQLKALKTRYSCIEKIELLPFRKLCIEKYDALGIPFPLADTPEAEPATVADLQAALDAKF